MPVNGCSQTPRTPWGCKQTLCCLKKEGGKKKEGEKGEMWGCQSLLPLLTFWGECSPLLSLLDQEGEEQAPTFLSCFPLRFRDGWMLALRMGSWQKNPYQKKITSEPQNILPLFLSISSSHSYGQNIVFEQQRSLRRVEDIFSFPSSRVIFFFCSGISM